MNSLTDEQLAAIERLQSEQPKGASSDERKRFMRAIASVPKEELHTAPEPPKEKRGRKPALRTSDVDRDGS
jgi:hypothetical protein